MPWDSTIQIHYQFLLCVLSFTHCFTGAFSNFHTLSSLELTGTHLMAGNNPPVLTSTFNNTGIAVKLNGWRAWLRIKKILGSGPSHAERPLLEWAPCTTAIASMAREVHYAEWPGVQMESRNSIVSLIISSHTQFRDEATLPMTRLPSLWLGYPPYDWTTLPMTRLLSLWRGYPPYD